MHKNKTTPEQQCRTCKEWKPLTEEFFHRNMYNKKTGFNTECKICLNEYYYHKRHGQITKKDIKELRESSKPEHFGEFEAQALRQARKRISQPITSMFEEIPTQNHH